MLELLIAPTQTDSWPQGLYRSSTEERGMQKAMERNRIKESSFSSTSIFLNT